MAVLLLAAAAAAAVVWRRQRKNNTGSGEVSIATSEVARLLTCQRYSFKEMSEATDNWNDNNLLGTGGFGTVYKGRDPNNPEILWAVKRAKLVGQSFMKEVIGVGEVGR